jgi:signal peptidase I
VATLDTHAGVRRRDGHESTRARSGADRSRLARAGWIFLQRLLLALALMLFLALAVLPRLGLYRPVTVLSGSMRPTFSPGDMIVVRPEPVSAVRVDQVISYQVPTGARQVETHRVIRVLSGGAHPVIQTQGDANNTPDPWTAKLEGSTAWQLTAVVPKLGYVVNALRSQTLRMVAIFIAPLLLALLFLLEIWGVRGGSDETREAETDPGASQTVADAASQAGANPRQREVGLPFVIGHSVISHAEGES